MNEFNPYAAPKADLSVNKESELNQIAMAERGTRLGAAILDALILLVPSILLGLGFYFSVGYEFWVPHPGISGIILTIVTTVIAAIIDLAINGVLLYRYGQTVGKKICKIKIVKENGQLPSLLDSFIKRRFAFTLMGQIPFVGGLIGITDVLFIFRKNNRCLHDYVAGTIVIKA